MKNIMFNDTYALTQAVLDGRKTMARRIEKPTILQAKYTMNDCIRIGGDLDDKGKWYFSFFACNDTEIARLTPRFQVGEIVAVAQTYRDLYPDADFEMVGNEFMTESAGWNNKKFVESQYMKHHIKITDVKMERLQDISADDYTKEGVGDFLKALCEKASEKYEKKADEIYWIEGRGYDQSLVYCYDCAKKEVEALNKKLDSDNDKYIVSGGYGQENEFLCFCEKCRKPLLFSFCGDVDFELPYIDLKYDGDLYILNQILLQDDNDREKAIRYLSRKGFTALIDKITGKGTWERNPWVVVYDFELID